MDLPYETSGRFSMLVVKNGARIMEYSKFHDPAMFWRSARPFQATFVNDTKWGTSARAHAKHVAWLQGGFVLGR